MIRLDQTTRSLGIVLGGAVAANELQVIVSYEDKRSVANSASQYLLGATQLATTNGATDVTICDAPPQSVVRDIDYVSVRNRDTAAVTVNIEYDNNGTDTVIYSATMAVGDFLCYTHPAGWQVYDSSNRLKSSAGVGLPGSSTANAVARWAGTAGTTIQNSSFLVDDSGHVTSFGGNIAFPATQAASAGANVLDDYEETDWTPVLAGSATAGSQTYSTQTGKATKVGRMVAFSYQIALSAKDAATAGDLRITGLPFTPGPESNVAIGYTANVDLNVAGGYYQFAGQVVAGFARIDLYEIGDNVGAANLTAADFGAATILTGSGVYFV